MPAPRQAGAALSAATPLPHAHEQPGGEAPSDAADPVPSTGFSLVDDDDDDAPVRLPSRTPTSHTLLTDGDADDSPRRLGMRPMNSARVVQLVAVFA